MMNDPYRTAADIKQIPPPRPYKILTVSWEENENWQEQLELGLMELSQAGYDAVNMTDDGIANLTVLLKLRG
jgi:hypothetical protein